MPANLCPCIGFCCKYLCIPAIDNAPAGSAITRVSSKMSFIAAQISSVFTVITSSTYSCNKRKGSVPIVFTATPSAKIPTEGKGTGFPAFKAACKQADSSDSTAMIFKSGLSCFKNTEIPAAKPPPPTAINRVSISEFCSSNSRPMVPCPTITSSSSKGATMV